MLRCEFVVDTIDECEELKDYLKSTAFRLNIDSIDIYCMETSESYFLTKRKLEDNLYTYYEET